MSATAPSPAPRSPARERSAPRAVLALVRLPNALIASVGVLLGAWWVQPVTFITRDLLLALLAAICATAAVNAANDAADIEIDRVAHPARPLPCGELSVASAVRVAGAAALLAFAFGRAASPQAGMLVLAALLCAGFYAVDINRRVILGNLLVAIVASLPFLVGAAAVGDPRDALPLFGVAVPLHLAREVMKDLADAAGDRGFRNTIPLAWGANVARVVALAAVAGYALLVTFLFASAGTGRLSLVPSVALAAWAVARASERRAPLLLKLSMLLAMAALPLLR